MRRLAGPHARCIERQSGDDESGKRTSGTTKPRAFDKRERTHDHAVMHGIASKLTELELKAVADFISDLD